ncbi:MAG: cupredoxin domain-containing protein [Actinomycetota bacterium]|nr:cupredoxin domain-containing protein [Actinomycetota bacterium]
MRTRLLVVSLAVPLTFGACSSGESGDDQADRQVTFEATEYSFPGMQGFNARQGERVEFVMTNHGALEHEFQVLSSGTQVGVIEPVPPGAAGRVTVTFEKTGSYRYFSDIADHATRGPRGTFTVVS